MRISVVEALKATQGYDKILLGHNLPADRKSFDATITYLRRAKQLYADAPDAKTFTERLKAAFLERGTLHYAQFTTPLLYRRYPEK